MLAGGRYISHLIVYPPEPRGTEAFEKKTTGNGWHIDGGRPVPEMEERPQPRLSLKVAYFLTDTTIPYSGAMRIVPRSHKMGDPPPAGTVDPPEAIDIRVKPGTAVLCASCLLAAGAHYLDCLRSKWVLM